VQSCDTGQGVRVGITGDTVAELSADVVMTGPWLAGLRTAAAKRGVSLAQFLELRLRGAI